MCIRDRVGTRHRAPGERDTHRACAIVRSLGHPFDLVQAHALLGGGTSDFEYGKVAGDSPASGALSLRGGRDVIRHRDDAYVDSLDADPVGCLAEIDDVARVVAEAEEYATSLVRRLQHGIHLRGGGRGEDVATRSAVCEARPDPAGEGRVVAGASAYDHGDLTRFGLRGPHDAAMDLSDVATVCCHQAVERLVSEVLRVVNEVGHHVTPEVTTNRRLSRAPPMRQRQSGCFYSAPDVANDERRSGDRATDVTNIDSLCDIRKSFVGIF